MLILILLNPVPAAFRIGKWSDPTKAFRLETVIVTCCWAERPDKGRLEGLKLQLYAAGRPVHAKASVLVSPPGVTVRMDVA
jgi:hypothetical protein